MITGSGDIVSQTLMIGAMVGTFVGFWPLIYGVNHDVFKVGLICFCATILAGIIGGLILCVPCACVCVMILKSYEKKKI